ncbi:44576_t:CDS:1, partial [Gigaspora margarita]
KNNEAYQVIKKVTEMDRVDKVIKPGHDNNINIKEKNLKNCKNIAKIDSTNELN